MGMHKEAYIAGMMNVTAEVRGDTRVPDSGGSSLGISALEEFGITPEHLITRLSVVDRLTMQQLATTRGPAVAPESTRDMAEFPLLSRTICAQD